MTYRGFDSKLIFDESYNVSEATDNPIWTQPILGSPHRNFIFFSFIFIIIYFWCVWFYLIEPNIVVVLLFLSPAAEPGISGELGDNEVEFLYHWGRWSTHLNNTIGFMIMFGNSTYISMLTI